MNKAILMGRLTRDPELRYTSTNNIPVCSFTLAVDRRFQRQGEENQADFIPIVTWRKTAEFCSRYFTKGKKVAVVGTIQTRSWDDPDGNRRYKTEVVSDEVYFAESKRAETGGSSQGNMSPDYSEETKTEENNDFPPVEDDGELPF